jgi:hypothetical protein
MLPNGDMVKSVIYFNIETGDQLTERQVATCNSIEALDFSCVTICNE